MNSMEQILHPMTNAKENLPKKNFDTVINTKTDNRIILIISMFFCFCEFCFCIEDEIAGFS